MEAEEKNKSMMLKGSKKKPHKKLSIQEKNLIIDLIESEKSKNHVSSRFGVTRQAIEYIMKRKDAIQEAKGQKHLRNKCRLHQGQHPLLERALLDWIEQKRSLGIAISGPLIREKALQFVEELRRQATNEENNETDSVEDCNGGEGSSQGRGFSKPKFQASDGWLSNFKARHGLRYLAFKGEKSSADKSGAAEFSEDMNQYIEENQYNLDNIYNVNETGLYTKSLPKKTFVFGEEKEVDGFKESKERVTVMNCANATGTHKLPLLLIGKSKHPRCFKNISQLPLIYKNQSNAWMNGNEFDSWFGEIFLEWYENVFIPSVLERKQGGEKFVLLLDNAPYHPPIEKLNSINPQFRVKYLPPNVSSLIQPMDQGVIQSMKRHYKKYFLRRLILQDNSEDGMKRFFKSWTLYDTVTAVVEAWKDVSQNTLKSSWKQLLGKEFLLNAEETVTPLIKEMMAKKHPDRSYSIIDAEEWIKDSDDIPAYRELSDIESLKEAAGNIENPFSDDEQEETDDLDAESDDKNDFETESHVKNLYQHFLEFRKWFESRKDCPNNFIESFNFIQLEMEAELYKMLYKDTVN